ncbi:MAG TPA: DUF6069 family protein [Pseudonocardiaceae bacterium]
MANIRSYRNLPTRIALPTALVASVVASLVVELVIAAIAHGAGAYSDFQPLTFGILSRLTVLGLLAAVVVWELVRRRAGDPVAVMRRLVPIVVVLSWVPDVLLGATHAEAHTTWGEVAVLMVMHLVVAVIGVGLFSRLLPLRRRPDAASGLGWELSSRPR